MANNREHTERVNLAVEHLHTCGAIHRAIVPDHEVFHGHAGWRCDVEVFVLVRHLKAKLAYAWNHLEGKNDECNRFVAVPEIPPVELAETAVRVQIVNDAKGSKK